MKVYGLNSKKQGKKGVCPNCGHRTFVYYLDGAGQILHDTVGRCDRENNCNYHMTPKQFFMNGGRPSLRPEVFRRDLDEVCSYIPKAVVEPTLLARASGDLYLWMSEKWGKWSAEATFKDYRVGTCKKWCGSTVFWQTDLEGLVRAGKIMRYDRKTGRRVKGVGGISWAHKELEIEGFILRQCLFGEHLLRSREGRDVAICESEKTAMIMSLEMPEYLWMATGGSHGLTEDRLRVLRGLTVRLFPDNGMYLTWREKARELRNLCKFVVDKRCEDEGIEKGADIADLIDYEKV